jgi:arylsulfatase A-like enzyme
VRPGSPNVVVIVLDDVGYAQLGCYGGSIETLHIDRLAAEGLRFTNFHVTSLCSTTRASLLTGRNHHSVGMGFLAAFDTGYPSFRGAVSLKAATLAEMLGYYGYANYAVGKWHLTPPAHMNPAGPFYQWPLGRGFDRYYGFLWGEDDQWSPQLWYDNHSVDPPRSDGYHLSEDLVDRARQFVGDHLSCAPDRPFFLYLAFGACHAPHQAPVTSIEKYRGAYDHGWDVERSQILNRQVELGVVPAGTSLAPLNDDVLPWDRLGADQRRLYARMQEVFAGFMDHTDRQIGRLVDFLSENGVLDNTIVVLLSDNGASGEGGPHGSANEYRHFLSLDDPFEETLSRIDELGGPQTHNHYPSGWAQAGNTPLRFYKKYTYGGGVRAPLVIRWPGVIEEAGGVRTQFHHVIDVVPTLLELTATTAPATHRGIDQIPLHGVSMGYALNQAGAHTTREVQYFETAGQRAIWRCGWKAVTQHEQGVPFDDDRWELYDLSSDFSETTDTSADHPDLVEELVEAWWEEAYKYQVLPLDDRTKERARDRGPRGQRRTFRLFPGARAFTPVAGPNFADRPFTIHAEVLRQSAADEGVLLAYGRRAAGFSLFVKNNRLVFDYNLAGHHSLVVSEREIPVGKCILGLEVHRSGAEYGARLRMDDETVGAGHLGKGMVGYGLMSTQCGHNAPSPVSDQYETPFRFTGDLHQVVVDLGDAAQSSRDEFDVARGQD